MLRTKKYLYFIICISLQVHSAFLHAQNSYSSVSLRKKIDSLKDVLKTEKDDSNKVITLNALSWRYKDYYPDSSLLFSDKAISLADTINYKDGMANALRNKGGFYLDNGNYASALKFYLESLKIAEEMKNKSEAARALSSIGVVYFNQDEYSKALNYYLQAVKIFEETGDKSAVARHLGNIGNTYAAQGDSANALKYYFKSLALKEKFGNKNGIAGTLGNIGNVYADMGDYSRALDYYFKAMNLEEITGNKSLLAITLGNIGVAYTETGRTNDAERYLNKALAIATEMNELRLVREDEHYLSDLYDKVGKPALAFFHYKKYIAMRDSLFNNENIKKQTRLEMNYEFEKKQSADSIKNSEHIKQEELKHEQEIQQQKIYTYGGAIGFSLMIVVAGISFRAYRTKQKANEIISKQKQLVEMKQKEILDSIHYAKKIQQSLLPTEKYIEKHLSRKK